jgi:membrane fusion protein (multidrug efflux system)
MPAALRVRATHAILLVITLTGGCGKKEAPPAAKGPVDVTVVTVVPRDTPAVFEYVAQTQSSRQVNIQARVNGFLDRRVYTEGAIVSAAARESGQWTRSSLRPRSLTTRLS